jgi:hypothetical protein
MVRHKGARSNKQREADHPHAVDVPIIGDGLGQNIHLIGHEADKCAGAEVWSHRTRLTDGTPQDWRRVGTKTPEDADRIAALFSHLQARRVR